MSLYSTLAKEGPTICCYIDYLLSKQSFGRNSRRACDFIPPFPATAFQLIKAKIPIFRQARSERMREQSVQPTALSLAVASGGSLEQLGCEQGKPEERCATPALPASHPTCLG